MTPLGACDDCGAPATAIVQDVREIEPVDRWARWQVDGDPVRLCDEHYRSPRQTRLDGSKWAMRASGIPTLISG